MILISDVVIMFLMFTAISRIEAFCMGGQHLNRGKRTALLGSRMKNRAPTKVSEQTEFIQVEADGQDVWKTMDIVDILQRGGLGVLPTETGYGFVCSLDSKDGLDRMLRIKGQHQCKKPMSVLCSDLSTIDKYCFGIDRGVFKILKKNLPGPYTFILPAKNELPKAFFLNSKDTKRQTLGVRIPSDPVIRYVQDELLGGVPLLISSLPVDEKEESQLLDCRLDPDFSWFNDVDFVVDAGVRPYDGSTIYDMTTREPELVREGLGNVELLV
jgi:tRNA threonylcarbamoyl adenosine modification protein (Sua5/YciO/YrdC/YwlC family)